MVIQVGSYHFWPNLHAKLYDKIVFRLYRIFKDSVKNNITNFYERSSIDPLDDFILVNRTI